MRIKNKKKEKLTLNLRLTIDGMDSGKDPIQRRDNNVQVM